jgi:hypothetical protein
MRSHKIEPYRSVFDATSDSGCPLCRYMRNYQAKCVQASLTPRPTGICNFHAWAIAAIHDRLDASQVFLNLLSSFSLGSDAPCDICVRLEKEDVVQLRLIGNSFKKMTPVQWLTTYGEICIPHSLELRKIVPATHLPMIDKAIARYRDKLVRSLQAQQGVDIEGAGWGVLGHAAEFLTGQRGLYR